MKTANHFGLLDGLRGIAALAVLALHTAIGLKLNQPVHAALAVDFFFCLSGFVIAHAYDRSFERGSINLSTFALKRIFRLYPMILLGVGLGFVATLLSATHGAPQPLGQVLFLTASAALLLPGGILFGLQSFVVDGPLWSLMFEALANAVYAAEASFRRRIPSLPFLAMSALFLAAVVAIYRTVSMLGFEHSYWFIGGVARVTFPFAAGVAISRSGIYRSAPRVPGAVLAGVLLAILFAPSTRFDLAFDVVAIVFAFPFIVASGAANGSGEARAWLLLGELSYPLYAIHDPIITLVLKVQNHLLHLPSVWAVAALAMAVSVTAAGLALVFYDRPTRAWLASNPWRTTRAVPAE